MKPLGRIWLSLASVLGITLAFVIVLQAKRIQTLENLLGGTQNESNLPEGMRLPDFHARDLTGKERTLTYGIPGAKPKVLYIFRPSCVWCQRNGKSINALTEQIKNRYEIIGIALDETGLQEFVREHQIKFPVYTDLPPSAIEAYRLGGTPETIVVSSEGIVQKAWMGGYSGPLQSAVEAFFSARLPHT
jgi:peroxiredoxin